MYALLQDLRFALRMLRRNRLFSAAAILTLAIGIGGNAAVFTVTSSVLLKPLPYANPANLVLIDMVRQPEGSSNGFTLNRFDLYRERTKSLAGIAVVTSDSMNLTGIGLPQQVKVGRVSDNFFHLLGVNAQLGRMFGTGDSNPESARTVIISDAVWHTTFGGDPHVVGRTIDLDSIPATIIGVLPAGIQFPFVAPADYWIPRYYELTLIPTERLRLGVGYLDAIGRLAPGASLKSALAEMEVLHHQYSEAFPKAPDAGIGIHPTVTNLQDAAVANIRTLLLVLSGAVGLVLLIACGNAANLLLWRALSRRQEIAMRVVLGARRAVIVRQLITEAVVLALISGAIGLVVGLGIVKVLLHSASAQLPSTVSATLDWRVVAFTIAVSVATGIVFGMVPALQSSRSDLERSLREESLSTTSSAGKARFKLALVAGQIAMSLLLLIGAALLLHSFRNLLQVDAGFDPHQLLTMNVSLSTTRYGKSEQQVAFFDELLRRVRALPEVESAAISSSLPPSYIRITPVLPEGQPNVPLAQRPFITIEMVSPDWAKTLRAPLQAGREFTDSDNASSAKVLIANQAFVRRFWQNDNPIGKHVDVGRQTGAEIVGVVADVKNRGLAAPTQPELYIPYAQLPWSTMDLVVRTRTEPMAAVPSIRGVVLSLDRDQPVSAIQTGEDLLASSRAQIRFTTMVLTAFAVTALILTIIGLYGVLAYSVGQRRRELAIRLALGAAPADLVSMLVRQAFKLVVIGLAVGLIACVFASRFLTTMIFRVQRLDPLAIVSASALLLILATLACYLPARRATRVSPYEALR